MNKKKKTKNKKSVSLETEIKNGTQKIPVAVNERIKID